VVSREISRAVLRKRLNPIYASNLLSGSSLAFLLDEPFARLDHLLRGSGVEG
jgi:ABC-type nitrate/sulfonate/bicarbonate transport system ATPase subunit